MQWFSNDLAVTAQRIQGSFGKYNLQKAFRFLLQSGAAPALSVAKLEFSFVALLGGELRHGLAIRIPAVKTKSSAVFKRGLSKISGN
ncbi:MAG: hypothetical protein JO076_11670 [Verrucomicrobia bacterium]|nr:hypothetical protein [Verrucomicrobiota bacterium]